MFTKLIQGAETVTEENPDWMWDLAFLVDKFKGNLLNFYGYVDKNA